MVQKRVSDKYLRSQVESATPGMLVVMLYDGAIKFLNTYKRKVDTNAFAEAFNLKMKAQNIIYELSASLNMEAGDVAHNLYRVYDYMMDKLISVDVLAKEVETVDEVIGLLAELRDAWKDIVEKPAEESFSLATSHVYA
ncbi:MAG TPA: flagellar export chaperone FliS [Candidatus Brocadiales bacterium]|nr:flagellar export chaperone FliS [Candidatus Brocadiales bacterium]